MKSEVKAIAKEYSLYSLNSTTVTHSHALKSSIVLESTFENRIEFDIDQFELLKLHRKFTILEV